MSRRNTSMENYINLRKKLLRGGAPLTDSELFIDSEFPRSLKSLYHNGIVPAELKNMTIVWKRPMQIQDNPKFIVNMMDCHDIVQGSLGNCWFIAGAALIASRSLEQFEKVVPLDQSFEPGQYTGMFVFYFWRYGKWTEVIIDDYLPTVNGRLIYSYNKGTPNEFWPPLLEKAYAKLIGSYEALIAGRITDALVDMTGGLSEVIDIKKQGNSTQLYSLLRTSFEMETLMGASIYKKETDPPGEIHMENGLRKGHAYSITNFQEVTTGRGIVNLIRLRNPWGHTEWTGKWSDGSREMMQFSEQKKKEYQLVNNKLDGEFWMSFDDFINNFDDIQLCHLQPDAFITELADNDKKQLWYVTIYHDAWLKGITAGGRREPHYQQLYWKNPQFYITIKSSSNNCTLIVSLMKKEKDRGKKTEIHVNFAVYKLKNIGLQPLDNTNIERGASFISNNLNEYSNREATGRFELTPGTYVIIPNTVHPDQEAEFLLRLFTDKQIDSGVLGGKVKLTVAQPSNDTEIKTYERHAGSDKKLDAYELSTYLENISAAEFGEPLKFPAESCRSLVAIMDDNKSGVLNLNEVKRTWKTIKAYRDVFKQFDVNKTNSVDSYELGTMFSKLGFPVSRNVLASIVKCYGGRDNQISLPDFVMMICKLTFLFTSFKDQQLRRNDGSETAEFTRNELLEVAMLT